MEFKLNHFLFSTIFLLSLADFIHSQSLTTGEKECFMDMIVLHYSFTIPYKMVTKNGKFVLSKHILPFEEDMKFFLDSNPQLSLELKKCIKKRNKGFIKSIKNLKNIFREEKSLMAVYEQIMVYSSDGHGVLAISKDLQGKFHNIQCFIDLMVMEGKWKMDSLLTPTANIEYNMMTTLFGHEINVSDNGATFLHNCIWKNMKFEMNVEHRILRLNNGTRADFLKTIRRTPSSDQLTMEIAYELHCVATHLVENFLVSTHLIIHTIPLYMRIDPAKIFQVHRSITATPALKRIDESSHGDLFNKLKECIHRKDLFLKADDHDSHEYVDIQAILAQGFVVVPYGLKKHLDQQSACLMEFVFVYSKVGTKAFEKVINFNPLDPVVNIAYPEYVFNHGTDEAFLLRLNRGPEAIAFIESGKHIYAEGSEEFNMLLKKCGVKMTVHGNGQNVNVFDLHRHFGLYHPQELFLTKLGMKDFEGMEIYKGSFHKKGDNDAVGTSADAVGTSPFAVGTSGVDGGHSNNDDDECPVCQNDLLDDENNDILKVPCGHVFHLNCFQGWITSLHTTCPACRHDMMFKMDKVVNMEKNMMIVREQTNL